MLGSVSKGLTPVNIFVMLGVMPIVFSVSFVPMASITF